MLWLREFAMIQRYQAHQLLKFCAAVRINGTQFELFELFRMLASRQTITQVRNSSGKLKELGIRLKSIRNIEKITKTMKMISSAKFAKVKFLTSLGVESKNVPPCDFCRLIIPTLVGF